MVEKKKDIVERLREIGAGVEYDDIYPECNEAADEIERLREEQAIFIRQINGLVEKLAKADAEIDKLQGFHEEWKRIDQQHRDGHDQDRVRIAALEAENARCHSMFEREAEERKWADAQVNTLRARIASLEEELGCCRTRVHADAEGIASLEQERDALRAEIKRAQAIIDGLVMWREAWLTRPHKSTPEMRARIRELATGRDDFDRAVTMLLDDFEAEEKARAAVSDALR